MWPSSPELLCFDVKGTQTVTPGIGFLFCLAIATNVHESFGESNVCTSRLRSGRVSAFAILYCLSSLHNVRAVYNAASFFVVELQRPLSLPQLLVLVSDASVILCHWSNYNRHLRSSSCPPVSPSSSTAPSLNASVTDELLYHSHCHRKS